MADKQRDRNDGIHVKKEAGEIWRQKERMKNLIQYMYRWQKFATCKFYIVHIVTLY